MEYDKIRKIIKLDRVLNNLDKFVIKFCNLLDEYVIVSGYVSILLGRSRATEDVNLLVGNMTIEEFVNLWNKFVANGFKCLNSSNVGEAFDYLKNHAIRFSLREKPIPNMEFKIAKNDLEKYSLKNKIKIESKGGELIISELEMQIAYKLFLGSEKDIEDAKHIYELFKEDLDINKIGEFVKKLNVVDEFKKINGN